MSWSWALTVWFNDLQLAGEESTITSHMGGYGRLSRKNSSVQSNDPQQQELGLAI